MAKNPLHHLKFVSNHQQLKNDIQKAIKDLYVTLTEDRGDGDILEAAHHWAQLQTKYLKEVDGPTTMPATQQSIQRETLYTTICETPGLAKNELQAKMGKGWTGITKFNVALFDLSNNGLIQIVQDGTSKRVYPASPKEASNA